MTKEIKMKRIKFIILLFLFVVWIWGVVLAQIPDGTKVFLSTITLITILSDRLVIE